VIAPLRRDLPRAEPLCERVRDSGENFGILLFDESQACLKFTSEFIDPKEKFWTFPVFIAEVVDSLRKTL